MPVFLWLLLGPHADGWAIVVLALSGVTDWADGKLARALGQSSRLGALLDSSLVQRSIAVQGESRFGMLETIGEYAREQLAQAGETLVLRRRHLEWCLALVQPGSAEPPDPKTIAGLTRELDNLRAGLRAAIDTGAVEQG